ncbi:MAG: hypothetical protein IH848_09800 [Acidobacteria bacterium]|nr:hypothetical protein [Acidobacteriota bacterium]
MKATTARTVLRVDFAPERPQRPTLARTGRVPRVARLLGLAHRIDGMIRDGELDDLADAARRLNLTRARVTQITNLLLLAPEIQAAILDLPPITEGRDPITERQLRVIVTRPDWADQISAWSELRPYSFEESRS